MNVLRGIACAAGVCAAFALTHAQTAAPRPPIVSISHISVYSSDSAKSDHFYVHDLGASKRADPENSAGVRYYFNPVQFVEVLPLPAGQTSINRLDHVAFNTPDAVGLRQYLISHGSTTATQLGNGSDGSLWFRVDDPEGNKVEFVQAPAKPAPVASNPLSVHIIHVGYMVHNPATENVFFRQLLGFRPYWYGGRNNKTEWISQQVPDGTDWLEYMTHDDPDTKGIPPGMSANALGSDDHFSLGVVNMEKTVNLLYSEDRLTARHSPPQIGLDGKWQLNLYDPDGTRAEIMEFQPAVKPCCSEFTASSPTQ